MPTNVQISDDEIKRIQASKTGLQVSVYVHKAIAETLATDEETIRMRAERKLKNGNQPLS